jgi:hypothetical protein
MPSQLHEALLLLFRNRPELAPELLHDVLGLALPTYTEARIASAELTDVQPAEYRADLVVLLHRGRPVLGIVVEVQLARDPDKPFVWPVYAAGLRARIRCATTLLVLAANDRVARWAARPIELGGGNRFAPFVIGPSGVPQITTVEQARADPELAVLSAIAHGKDPDPARAVEIALAATVASDGLDAERAGVYYDLIVSAMSRAARKVFQSMNPETYVYQSDFARRYLARGEAKGRAEGRAELLLKLLGSKFGAVPPGVAERVRCASVEELDTFAERLLTAEAIDEVFGTPPQETAPARKPTRRRTRSRD